MKKSKKIRILEDRRREGILLVIFLGIASGTLVFLFFLSTKDVKMSQYVSEWEYQQNQNIDKIVGAISNCSLLEHPFLGVSKECYFRRSVLSGALNPSVELEGFRVAEGGLIHVVKNASGIFEEKAFDGIQNPVITGVKTVEFARENPRLLKMTLTLNPIDESGKPRIIERMIFLKNH